MTEQPVDRLDLIESLLLQTAQSQRTTQQQLDQLTLKVDQLSDSVDANAEAIAELRQAQEVDRADFRASLEDLVQMGVETYQLVVQNSNEVRLMQTDIRGMQVESRRILRELRDDRRGEG